VSDRLLETKLVLQKRMASLEQTPPDLILDDLTRWEILSVVAQNSGGDPAWQNLLDEYPPQGSLVSSYTSWLEMAAVFIETSLQATQDQILDTEAEQEINQQKHEELVDKSRGLSSTLVVEQPFTGVWQIKVIRPTALLALIGGLVGLLAWSTVWLVRISLRK